MWWWALLGRLLICRGAPARESPLRLHGGLSALSFTAHCNEYIFQETMDYPGARIRITLHMTWAVTLRDGWSLEILLHCLCNNFSLVCLVYHVQSVIGIIQENLYPTSPRLTLNCVIIHQPGSPLYSFLQSASPKMQYHKSLRLQKQEKRRRQDLPSNSPALSPFRIALANNVNCIRLWVQ